jgi:hypothetical protein
MILYGFVRLIKFKSDSCHVHVFKDRLITGYYVYVRDCNAQLHLF